jgi:hypothetical protein
MKMKDKMRICLVMIAVFTLIINSGCENNRNQDNPHADKNVLTSIDRTIVPDYVSALPTVRYDDVANYAKNGYGFWHFGPGVPCQKRLDLMPAGYGSSISNTARLLRFFTISDIHISDKESPVQAIFYAPYLGSGGLSFYSPLMLYTTHMLDATVRTINRLHKQDPIDFGIATGDLANNTQYNELRWFIDIMDGKNINPDSGDNDDPVEGPNNDYQDEYQSEDLIILSHGMP